jgi:hypothetical protein
MHMLSMHQLAMHAELDSCPEVMVLFSLGVRLFNRAGGVFSMAYEGSAQSSVAKFKEQIMLTGGILTSLVTGPSDAFRTYTGAVNGGVYDPRDVTDLNAAELHALFCYG